MTAFEKYLSLLKAHEKLLIFVALVLFGLHLYGSGLNAWVEHEKRQDDVALETAKTSAAKYVEVQQQLSDVQKQASIDRANLNAAMATRAVDTQKQKEADDKLAGQELAARLQALLVVNPGDVTWSAIQGDLVFTENAGHKVADVVDDNKKLQADAQDLKQIISSDQTVIVKQTDTIVSANVALADEKNAHQKDVDLLKAQSHGQYMKGLKHGVVIGLAASEILRFLFTKTF
jgi:hypothetical protein